MAPTPEEQAADLVGGSDQFDGPRWLAEAMAALVHVEEVLSYFDEATFVLEDCDGANTLLMRFADVAPSLALAIETVELHISALYALARLPLADAFPDGTAAATTLTARQVLYLRDLAARQNLPDSANPSDSAPSRTCEGRTTRGVACRSRSLTWTERAICRSHASAEELVINAQRAAEHADAKLAVVRDFVLAGGIGERVTFAPAAAWKRR